MFVKNANKKDCIRFSRLVQEYLTKNGVPVYAMDDGNDLFRDSEILRDVISKSPKWIQWSAKKEGFKFEKNKV